jgi:hypothetical protein
MLSNCQDTLGASGGDPTLAAWLGQLQDASFGQAGPAVRKAYPPTRRMTASQPVRYLGRRTYALASTTPVAVGDFDGSVLGAVETGLDRYRRRRLRGGLRTSVAAGRRAAADVGCFLPPRRYRWLLSANECPQRQSRRAEPCCRHVRCRWGLCCWFWLEAAIRYGPGG